MKPLNIIILVLLLAFLIALLKESKWIEEMWPDIEPKWIWEVKGDRINVDIE